MKSFNHFVALVLFSALTLLSACSLNSAAPDNTPLALSYSGGPFVLTNSTVMTSVSPTFSGTATAYSVSPALPAGLSLNTTTGVISGTPLKPTAAADYTVTVTTVVGTATAKVNVTVNAAGWKVVTLAGPASPAPTSGPASMTTMTLNQPRGIWSDTNFKIYVSEATGNRIQTLDTSGNATVLAGSGTAGLLDGTGTAAKLRFPFAMVTDASFNLFVPEWTNHVVRKITPAGVVSVFAGSPAGTAGLLDGVGTAALVKGPTGITIDTTTGIIYFTEYTGNRILKLGADATVTTIAGSTAGTGGFTNANGTSARFALPNGITIDPTTKNLYVSDAGNNVIRMIDASFNVTTLAGSATGTSGSSDGTGSAASFNFPVGIVRDSGTGNLYVADGSNSLIRMVTTAGVVTTIAGSTAGYADGLGTAAKFNGIYGLAIDGNGNLLVADNGNGAVRIIYQ